jgi:hypothetical protein
MNINALPGMGPNGFTTILLYRAGKNHENVTWSKHGLYASKEGAMAVARRMIDWLKDVFAARGVVTEDDVDLVFRRAHQAFVRLGY